jgi:hypothetical protein
VQVLSEEEKTHNIVLYTTTGDPYTYEKALRSREWREAMDNEISAIERNGT